MAVATTDGEEWKGFIDRAAFTLDQAEAVSSFAGKRILVTGAGGWIGSALVLAIAAFAPDQLVLLEAAERNLYQIDAALRRSQGSIRYTSILGSVSQPSLLADIFHRYRPEIVFHAAAFKQVPLMEQNPFAAIENNAIGTYSLAMAAANSATGQLISLSTDKAVDPVSIMGASKRIAELSLLAHHPHLAKSVRLGNVLGSEGSIVPLFTNQIQSGLPVTVTHREVRRYFLTTAEAIALLLHAASETVPSGILVPALGEPLPVAALARHLISKRKDEDEIPVVFTELRPGDKMCEAMLSSRESFATSLDTGCPLRGIASPGPPAAAMDEILQQLQRACRDRSLEELMAWILIAVPEYQPSASLQSSLAPSVKVDRGMV